MDKSFYKQTTIPDFATEEKSAVSLPSKIGPYKIESLLSKGGMSLLYLGLHATTKEPLAIKVLSPEFVTHPESIARFLKEAHIIELANHPNIVKLYGQGKWEGGLYIAMELIRGISLRQFIIQQSLSLKRCLDIILQVAYALLHLHTHGVIHRDLKPENILITEDGEVKVIDFGIAQLHEEKEKEASKIMGTPDYMSPEQKQDPSKISYSSDIYSLGIIAYELVLGKLSYGMINLSLLPQGFRKIIEKALAVSVKERYQDIVDFISDISNYLKSKEIEKDRSGNDQLKEFLEILNKASASLSPYNTPEWPELEIGLAKNKTALQNPYYDFFRLGNNTYLFLAAEPSLGALDHLIGLGIFRGLFRALLHDVLASKEPFHLLPFLTKVNAELMEDPLRHAFNLSLLLLDPLNNQLSFVSCGPSALFHISAESAAVRKLESKGPAVGTESNPLFFEVEDNWMTGDSLVFSSFMDSSLESTFRLSFVNHAVLSAQTQAEAILKNLSAAFNEKEVKLLLSIQRIS